MNTRLRTRAFILCFLPLAILLTTSFWMIQRFVQASVRERLHASLHDSQIVSRHDLQTALATCGTQTECDLRPNGANWIPPSREPYGNGSTHLSPDDVDLAMRPIQAKLHKLFVELAIASVLVALLCSFSSSTTIVNPIAAVMSHLPNAVPTGKLGDIDPKPSPIVKIQELAQLHNEPAVSVHAAGERLSSAYLQFVGSLANALDARDQYTAGHSRRVSELSCALATALQLPAEDVERIRIGALLHDIGKIGVSDSVLQKPGRLTDEEFDQVKQHPVIGRRILEGVQGFAEYLPAVELHHENWNGTGYPHGQRTTETPIDARIIHVADAYDAMTTDRSYRSGMTHEKALSILVENTGIQFDPEFVATFLMLPRATLTGPSIADELVDEVEQPEPAVVG